MFSEVHIKNFKSIRDLKLSLGRVTVLIGENGCGKSNILEGIGFAAAAAANKLDNEFLVSRGIRITSPRFMFPAFEEALIQDFVSLSLKGPGGTIAYDLVPEDSSLPFPSWKEKSQGPELKYDDKGNLTVTVHTRSGSANSYELRTSLIDAFQKHFSYMRSADGGIDKGIRIKKAKKRPPESAETNQDFQKLMDNFVKELSASMTDTVLEKLTDASKSGLGYSDLQKYLVYSPENSFLRTFEVEGQIQPLGIKGEGLFQLVKAMCAELDSSRIEVLKKSLSLIDWFSDLRVPMELAPYERRLEIKDRYLADNLSYFDQRSSNEGFLFLLFYLALLVGEQTPPFFAIDNIDASLNPKLCSELMRQLVWLATKYDKQLILTTHNPAILDGLNLHDDQQRLFVVYRSSKGFTRVRQVSPPEPVAGELPVKLSEAFLRGLLGGLPQNF